MSGAALFFMIRGRLTVRRGTLNPAMKVRSLPPEPCTGSQVARHAPAKRATWVRFPSGALLITDRTKLGRPAKDALLLRAVPSGDLLVTDRAKLGRPTKDALLSRAVPP